MQVEARLVCQTQRQSSPSGTVGVQLDEDCDHLKSRSAKVTAEFRSWARLFSSKFIDRTWIGILMMVFQRESVNSKLHPLAFPTRRSCGRRCSHTLPTHKTFFLMRRHRNLTLSSTAVFRLFLPHPPLFFFVCRMERDQRIVVLWPDAHSRNRFERGHYQFGRFGRDWDRAVCRCAACDRVYRQRRTEGFVER